MLTRLTSCATTPRSFQVACGVFHPAQQHRCALYLHRSLASSPGHAASVVTAAAVRDVSPAEANALLPQYTYLDVRTPEEFLAGHAPGAINVPVLFRGPAGMALNPQFQSQVEAAFPSMAEPLIVACKAGGRSVTALQSLSKEYVDLVHMRAGWDGWMAAGLPVEIKK